MKVVEENLGPYFIDEYINYSKKKQYLCKK